jgi:hypothetical protein
MTRHFAEFAMKIGRMQRITRILLSLAVLTLVGVHSEAKTSSCPPSPNVSVTVYDYDLGGVKLFLGSDDFNGSGQASYSVADTNVRSNIYCGKLFFDLYSQSIRTLWIDPTHPLSGWPAGPPAGYYWQNVELASSCYDANGNQVNLQNVLTSSNNCGMILDFNPNGTKYKLSMGHTCSSCPPEPYLTGQLTVTCLQTDSTGSSCVHWTFTPNTTASSTNAPTVANLFSYTGHGQQVLVFIGQYYFTQRFEVSSP